MHRLRISKHVLFSEFVQISRVKFLLDSFSKFTEPKTAQVIELSKFPLLFQLPLTLNASSLRKLHTFSDKFNQETTYIYN